MGKQELSEYILTWFSKIDPEETSHAPNKISEDKVLSRNVASLRIVHQNTQVKQ